MKDASLITYNQAMIETKNRIVQTEGMADRDTRAALVLEAAKLYPTPKGGVAWTSALAENPQWRPLLGAGTRDGMIRLYAFTSSVLEKDRKVNGTMKQTRRGKRAKLAIARLPRQIVQDKTARVLQQPVGCNFCPECGADITLHNQIAAAKRAAASTIMNQGGE